MSFLSSLLIKTKINIKLLRIEKYIKNVHKTSF